MRIEAHQIKEKLVKVPEKFRALGANRELKKIAEIKDKVLGARKKLVAEIGFQYTKNLGTTEGKTEAETIHSTLSKKTEEFKRSIREGEKTLDDLLPEAFAVASIAAEQVLGQTPYEVQIMGGIALHLGKIAEMKTGEGKTLASLMPAYLNTLTGKGVHIVTANEYLVQRDAAWMGRVHEYLGITVGTTLNNGSSLEKKDAYSKDITYGTATEFGHDFLRDNQALSSSNQVQRGHNFVIVDEADYVLLDQARTPLILSGAEIEDSDQYRRFVEIAAGMVGDGDNKHYDVDDLSRVVSLTPEGIDYLEKNLGIDNLYESPFIGYINNALKAKEVFHRDQDYIVDDGTVLIIDEYTHRPLYGRRFGEGLHQAIEAKEGLEIHNGSEINARITIQNYFQKYDKLSGLTGTARRQSSELDKVYNASVTVIPPHRPRIRQDNYDIIFEKKEDKFNSIVDDVIERFFKHGFGEGQPILIGAGSVEDAEVLSLMLRRQGVPHNVLNAKNDEQEADVIAQAGRKGAVTVATSMAGRGTDILLGGDPVGLTNQYIIENGLSESEYDAVFASIKEHTDAEHDVVNGELGGLYVIGVERHESRRIDDQLKGRSGRQGERGETQFYISLEDELVQRFNEGAIRREWDKLNVSYEGEPIINSSITQQISVAQNVAEQQSSKARTELLKYDNVLNTQSEIIYNERQKILDGKDVRDDIFGFMDVVVDNFISEVTAQGYPEEWDFAALWSRIAQIHPLSISAEEVLSEYKDTLHTIPSDVVRERIKHRIIESFHKDYANLASEVNGRIGEGAMMQYERRVLLAVLDRKWVEHLYEMDYLLDGIELRRHATKFPEIEYQREGSEMYLRMLTSLRIDTLKILLNLNIESLPAKS